MHYVTARRAREKRELCGTFFGSFVTEISEYIYIYMRFTAGIDYHKYAVYVYYTLIYYACAHRGPED